MEDIEILENVIKEIEANGDFDTIDNPIEVAKAIENLIARNKELENRFLEIIINGKPFKIKNDVKELQYIDFKDNEFTLEVLEKWK